MTTKDIIENMKKEFDELTFKYEGIDEPLSLDSKEEAIIKSFIHSYTLTLLESFGEEVIGHDLKVPPHTHITAMEVMAENRQKASQRLKVKEIISSIGK